jgi:NIMA (never in mitosis gene a)-related kinase
VRRIIDNTEYALKKVKLSSLDLKEKESALNEIRILASIQSQFIISYKDAFLDETSNTLCIVMEIATDGDLLNKINRAKKLTQQIPEIEIWKAFKDMTLGIIHISQN